MPSTALREVSLLQMLSESAFIVRYAPRLPRDAEHVSPNTAIVACPTNGFFKQTGSILRARGGAARANETDMVADPALSPVFPPARSAPDASSTPHRLLKVEHVEEDGKAMLYLVFEYLDQDLKNYMDMTGRGPSNPLPKPVVQDFMYQLCLGCAHLHRHGVMHRDLKPQNLLVDKAKNVIKVADLGLGRAFSVPVKSYTHEIVTLWYRAPEVLLGGSHYSTPVDMWSVGTIFAELARKQPLFPGDSELQQLLHIFKLLGTPSEDVWPGVTRLRDWHEFPQWKQQDLHKVIPQLDKDGIDLLQKMLVYDPAKRIHATDALDHPYFDSLDKSRYAKIEAQFEKENRAMN